MVLIVAKFSSSSFIWHQIWAVMPTHSRAKTMWNFNVKIRLRRIKGYGLYVCTTRCRNGQAKGWFNNISISLCFFVMHVCPNLPPPPPFTRCMRGRMCVPIFLGKWGNFWQHAASGRFPDETGKRECFCEWNPIPEIEGFILFPRQLGVRVMGNEHMYPLVLCKWGVSLWQWLHVLKEREKQTTNEETGKKWEETRKN